MERDLFAPQPPAHRHGPGCGCAVPTLGDAPPDLGPVVVMSQTLDPVITAALDAVPAENLPEALRLEGPAPELARGVMIGLAACDFGPAWLREWLVDNVRFQIRLYGELTKRTNLRLRLERVDDDGCPRFHTDNVARRLVCTYRGPGTEWIDPKAASAAGDVVTIDARHIRRAERGAIALMRGRRDETRERPALLHRSPPIEGTGVARLLLAIDEG